MSTPGFFTRTALGLLGWCLASFAHGQITFDGLANTNLGNFGSSSIASQGFTFTTIGFQGIGDSTSLNTSEDLPASGKFLAYNSTNGVGQTFFATSGTPFNLLSIDLGGWYNFGENAQSIKVVGIRDIGSNESDISVSVGVLPHTFTHFAFSGFNNLSAVKLVHEGSVDSSFYVGVDNINITVTPVPEPEAIAMLLVGLGVVAVAARRRKRA